MMKLELTKEEAEKLIKQLQEFVEEKNETLYPDVEKGKDYWYISNTGLLCTGNMHDDSSKYLANIYKTQEIAVKALQFKKSRKVWNFIENWAMHNSTFEPDWKDNMQCKYYIWYDSKDSMWYTYWTSGTYTSAVYMSKEEANRLVKILNSSDSYK